MSVYDWIDPWAEIDAFERQWRDREDEHREQMSTAARAFADATYAMRRHAETMLEPIIRTEALQNRPPRMSLHHIDGNPRNNDPANLRVVPFGGDRK